VKRSVIVVALAMGMVLVGFGSGRPAQAATSTKTVRYGPFTIPGGTATDPGMIHNKLLFGVARPCVDCHIIAFTPDLVYADGTRANMDTGPMLHHMVLTSQWRSDATCAGSWLGLAGERFFASGNERTPIAFPAGYGYRVRYYDSWNLLVDLMNHSTEAKTVYVQVTFTIRPSWESVARLKPVWLDIDQCGDSEYSIQPATPIPTGTGRSMSPARWWPCLGMCMATGSRWRQPTRAAEAPRSAARWPPWTRPMCTAC
jgi:hypothetical protein